MQIYVPTCLLDFGQAGLSCLPTSACVAYVQPTYNQKARYLPIRENVQFVSSIVARLYEISKNCKCFALNGYAVGSSLMASLGDSFLNDGFSLV